MHPITCGMVLSFPPWIHRCVAQQEGEKLLRRVPEIDLVMGPQYANRLGDLLEDVMNGNQVMVVTLCLPAVCLSTTYQTFKDGSVAQPRVQLFVLSSSHQWFPR